MDLLTAILVALGCHFSPVTPATSATAEQVAMTEYATYIRDNGLYHITAEEGVVIDVSVNPNDDH